jgi:hypothetical protein
VDIDNRLNILRNARNAGICNFAFIFFGFPAETQAEARQTIKMVCENSDIINAYGKCAFTMGKHTKLRENPEKYGVIGDTHQEAEFSPTYEYNATGMSKEELNNILNECSIKCNEIYGNTLAMYLGYRELLFLYRGNGGHRERYRDGSYYWRGCYTDRQMRMVSVLKCWISFDYHQPGSI